MINFINNKESADEIFAEHVYMQMGSVYAPQLVSPDTFSIIGYLAYCKVDFKPEALTEILELLEITNINEKLINLDQESKLLIHYLSFLTIDCKHIYLDLPSRKYSPHFISKFWKLLTLYNEREITVITDDMQVAAYHKHLHQSLEIEPIAFDSRISKGELLQSALGGKYVILASLIAAILVMTLPLFFDNKVRLHETDYFDVPENIIAIKNKPNFDSYNKFVFQMPIPNQDKRDHISYDELESFLDFQEVISILYDEGDIQAGVLPKAKVPINVEEYGYDLQTVKGRAHNSVPCINFETTESSIICEEYNTNVDRLFLLNKDNIETFRQNIVRYDKDYPNFIFIETDKPDQVAKYLARLYPNISILTTDGVSKYTKQFYRHLLVTYTSIYIAIIFFLTAIVFIFVSKMKMSVSGKKYHQAHLVSNPIAISRLSSGLRSCYYSGIVIFSIAILSHLATYKVSFHLGIFLIILNATLWFGLGHCNGRKFTFARIALKEACLK